MTREILEWEGFEWKDGRKIYRAGKKEGTLKAGKIRRERGVRLWRDEEKRKKKNGKRWSMNVVFNLGYRIFFFFLTKPRNMEACMVEWLHVGLGFEYGQHTKDWMAGIQCLFEFRLSGALKCLKYIPCGEVHLYYKYLFQYRCCLISSNVLDTSCT